MRIFFATSNRHKVEEANDVGGKYNVIFVQKKIPYNEIRSASLENVARSGIRDVYEKLKKPAIVEDSGLFIKALDDFPSCYSKFVFERIGDKGILNLVKRNRRARFISVVGYTDGKLLKTFEGIVHGKISLKQRGSAGFGYDPIFIPEGYSRTFAEDPELKARVSHRRKSIEKFCRWIISRER